MKKRVGLCTIAVVALGGLISIAADKADHAPKTEGVKCIMADKNVNAEKSAEWKEGKVFFCCGGCLGKFEKMTDEEKSKLAAKANSQLVATEQYEQEVCPFSGGKLNADTKIKVNGASVAFCCNNCKGKAEKMEGADQVEALFGEKAFEKAKFKPVKHEDK